MNHSYQVIIFMFCLLILGIQLIFLFNYEICLYDTKSQASIIYSCFWFVRWDACPASNTTIYSYLPKYLIHCLIGIGKIHI